MKHLTANAIILAVLVSLTLILLWARFAAKTSKLGSDGPMYWANAELRRLKIFHSRPPSRNLAMEASDGLAAGASVLDDGSAILMGEDSILGVRFGPIEES